MERGSGEAKCEGRKSLEDSDHFSLLSLSFSSAASYLWFSLVL